MIQNPSIDELRDSGNYELVRELPHHEVKEFVISLVKERSKLIGIYFFYQTTMVILGLFFLGLSVFEVFRGLKEELFYTAAALVFSFTVLIVLHELLHGFAFKIVGASRVSYGAYLKKMMFYAEADKFVLSRRQFSRVALFPLFVVKLISIAGIIFFFEQPAVFFFIILMCLHSLFCAGDIALLSFFYQNSDEIYTYDNKNEKKSYYFRKRYPGQDSVKIP